MTTSMPSTGVTRRRFLAGAAILGAGTVLSPRAAWAKSSPFVRRSGAKYVLHGRPWGLFGGSIYGTSNPGGAATIVDTIDLAVQAHLNTLRIVNFIDEGTVSAPTDPAVAPYNQSDWERVDAILDALRANNLKAVLDLSTYRNCLQNWLVAEGSQVTPYSYDWSRFIHFVAKRVNSVNGVPYRKDPTIAFVSFAGEPNAPNSQEPLKPTTQELTDFYSTAMTLWRKVEKNHMLSSGGLLQIDWEEAFGNPEGSGIDWQAIYSLPHNDVPSIHSYWHTFPPTSANDFRSPKVSAYCATIHKPWITEEFGFLQQPVDNSTDPPTLYTEADRGSWYQTVYDIQKEQASHGAAFWNLGEEVSADSYDVNLNTPATWATVLANASTA